MSIFDTPKNIDKLIERVLATLDRVDALTGEALLLVRNANEELTALRQVRQKMQAALGEK